MKKTNFQLMLYTFTFIMILATQTTAQATTQAATQISRIENRTLCVFDPMGAYGDTYGLIKEYAQKMKVEGVDFTLKAYTDESVAANDFIGPVCDAAVLTGTRARDFNNFTGTIEAMGALPTYQNLRVLLNILGNNKLSKYMKKDEFEVSDVYPVGAVFLFVNDKNINSVGRLAGKRLATMNYDDAANTMVTQIGAAPVNSHITNFGGKFNNGAVDVCYSPSLGYNAFELYKGLDPNGGIIRFPLAQMNAQIIVKRNRFPENFGDTSRKLVISQLTKAFDIIDKKDQSIDEKWWIELPSDDKEKYLEMFRDVRITLEKTNIYHTSMLKLMKKIRCKENPASTECSMKGG